MGRGRREAADVAVAEEWEVRWLVARVERAFAHGAGRRFPTLQDSLAIPEVVLNAVPP